MLILYTFPFSRNSARPSMVSILTVGLSLCLLHVSWLIWSQQFNRTHFR